MSKHTPEPWDYDYEHDLLEGYHESAGTGEYIVTFHAEKEEDAARIVDCVNACAHIDNPVEWLPKMIHNISAMSDEIHRQKCLNNELKAERVELLLTIKRLSQTFLKDKTAKEITDWLRKECNQVLDKAKEASHEG